jgi:hypothetical protein
MEFIWAPCAQLYSLAKTPQPSPHPLLGSYTRALLVSQDRHLFVCDPLRVPGAVKKPSPGQQGSYSVEASLQEVK